ncbi:MAG: hypothetical protein ACTHMI_20665 [Mucilaginibacter sp.]
MKSIYTIAILIIIMVSCKKGSEKIQRLPPQRILFEITDSKGNGLITSKHDNIVISYTENGVTNTSKVKISNLYLNETDTAASSSQYHGLIADDGAVMANWCMGHNNATGTFYLSLNGNTLGTITLDYNGYLKAYPQISSASFSFNNHPVVLNMNVGYSMNANIFQTP